MTKSWADGAIYAWQTKISGKSTLSQPTGCVYNITQVMPQSQHNKTSPDTARSERPKTKEAMGQGLSPDHQS
eukprot:12296763-Ditylum_brightwellii.AAC.1